MKRVFNWMVVGWLAVAGPAALADPFLFFVKQGDTPSGTPSDAADIDVEVSVGEAFGLELWIGGLKGNAGSPVVSAFFVTVQYDGVAHVVPTTPGGTDPEVDINTAGFGTAGPTLDSASYADMIGGDFTTATGASVLAGVAFLNPSELLANQAAQWRLATFSMLAVAGTGMDPVPITVSTDPADFWVYDEYGPESGDLITFGSIYKANLTVVPEPASAWICGILALVGVVVKRAASRHPQS
ncbi:MAG: hypothetical protein H7A45_05645 [Verrucomicrobiales bacterium]|nr:hypothetical protein [Verrucomicrobiales bacterium]